MPTTPPAPSPTASTCRGLTPRAYAWQSLRHHWRVNSAVMLGIVAGTAVLTGALLVGDSVRSSLERLTLERLGRIDEILVADHFFRAQLAAELDLTSRPLNTLTQAVPAILLSQATVERSSSTGGRRVGQVTVLGCDKRFWELGRSVVPLPRQPTGREVVLNRPLADDLKAQVGDRIVIRLPKATRIAGDSPLGEKNDRVESLAELEVIEIVSAEGLGRFSLQASQALPRSAFLSIATLQGVLKQPGRVNAILIAGPAINQAPDDADLAQLRRRIRPTLEDTGLRLKPVELTQSESDPGESQVVFRYLSLSTETMLFRPAADQAIRAALEGFDSQAVLTYLANRIERAGGETSIPYSTVSALEANPSLTPLVDAAGTPLGPMADDEIVLNEWAARDLDAKPGDSIRLTYFAAETTHGKAEEQSAELKLRAVVPLTRPARPYERDRPAVYFERPSRANDPDLTPEVPGITDQESIDAWDPPFPFSYDRIRQPEDEDYWDEYRTTPKAFVNMSTGVRLWGSRFGSTTSIRIAATSPDQIAAVEQRLRDAIQADPVAFGLSLLHVKQDGLRASRGSTPFNILFLLFSVFIIAAALMLVSLLFRLSLEQRASEVGLLLAVGLNRGRVAHLFSVEGWLLAILGAVAGAVAGVGYAALMIAGLRTWWLDAVVTPFLELHLGPFTLPIGMVVGVMTSILTIRVTLAGLRRASLRALLAKQLQDGPAAAVKARQWAKWTIVALSLVAVGSGIFATRLRGESQAIAFFGCGGGVMAALLLQISEFLRRPQVGRSRQFGFRQLVVRNLARNPSRSTLTLGLMAMACFLIVAVSAFRLAPTEQGTGGFPLLAQTDIPIFDDLNDPATRLDLLGSQATKLDHATIFALRLQPGDDASCRNLYQARRPRLLGVSDNFIAHYDEPDSTPFGWAASAAESESARTNPWHLLQEASAGVVPVVLDKNTAMYSLHLYGGIGEEFQLDYEAAGPIRFRVVGLLANSVLQGSLLVGERALLEQFPQLSGYQFLTVACPVDAQEGVRQTLEDLYRDQGLVVTETRALLENLLAVQNTYLSTFQSLGGLGLLLGTFGLVAVQLRSVFERRGELALLRATGFSQQRLRRLVLLEHVTLLVGGLGVGVVAALVAVIPHAWTTDVRPPWETLAVVLGTILAVGMTTGYLALRPMVRAPLMQALRGD